MPEIKRVLLVYTDPYYLVKQVYPFGLDMLAARLSQEGVAARIEHAFLPDADPKSNLARVLEDFQPDLVGLGLRNIDTCMACETYGDMQGEGFRSFYFLPEVRTAVEAVRELLPDTPVIVGGGGFTTAPAAILRYLDAEYGAVGEGEEVLAEFIRAWPNRDALSEIPGLVIRGESATVPRRPFRFPAFQDRRRDAGFRHSFESAGLPVRVKRGCNQGCIYCVEPIIEGRRFVYRDIGDVTAELSAASDMEHVNKVFFVDTEFNVPDEKYATGLVKAILDAGLHERFRFASQFLPRPFDEDFAGLLAEAGFSVILTCTSFADSVLESSGASYREADIMNALELCARFELDATVDLIFGLPGETEETMEHTVARMREYPDSPLRHYEYTVGARIYPGTPLAAKIEREGQSHVYGEADDEWLSPCFYCTPGSPLELKARVDAAVPSPMRFDNEISENSRARLAVSYLSDRGRFREAYDVYLRLPLADKSAAFDYFFRSMAEAGHAEAARMAAVHLKQAITDSADPAYMSQTGVIDYYLHLLDQAGV